VCGLLALSAVHATNSFLEYFSPSTYAISPSGMNYSSSLDCGACIRGGYDICPFMKERGCIKKADEGMFCSNLFADKYNFLYNFCPKTGPACEESKTDFEIKNHTDTAVATFFTGTVGQSCTYHVKTRCGFPRLMVNITTNPEHYNVLYGLGNWNDTDTGFNFTMYKQTWFTADNSESISLNDKNTGTWLSFRKGEDKLYKNCTSRERHFYVTVVRTQIPTDPIEIAEARML